MDYVCAWYVLWACREIFASHFNHWANGGSVRGVSWTDGEAEVALIPKEKWKVWKRAQRARCDEWSARAGRRTKTSPPREQVFPKSATIQLEFFFNFSVDVCFGGKVFFFLFYSLRLPFFGAWGEDDYLFGLIKYVRSLRSPCVSAQFCSPNNEFPSALVEKCKRIFYRSFVNCFDCLSFRSRISFKFARKKKS